MDSQSEQNFLGKSDRDTWNRSPCLKLWFSSRSFFNFCLIRKMMCQLSVLSPADLASRLGGLDLGWQGHVTGANDILLSYVDLGRIITPKLYNISSSSHLPVHLHGQALPKMQLSLSLLKYSWSERVFMRTSQGQMHTFKKHDSLRPRSCKEGAPSGRSPTRRLQVVWPQSHCAVL